MGSSGLEQALAEQTARAERAEVQVDRIRAAAQSIVESAQSVVLEANNLGGIDERELHSRTLRLTKALARWRSVAAAHNAPTTVAAPAEPPADGCVHPLSAGSGECARKDYCGSGGSCMPEAERKRINVAVTPDMLAALDRIIAAEQISLTEAVRRLIGYGDYVYRAIREDGAVILRRDLDGDTREVVLL
jgi:hypothetical protein